MSQFFVGVTAGSLPPVVPTTFHTDDSDAIPAANILNIYGDTGISTAGSGNTVTISYRMPWEDKAVTFNAAVQTGYFCEGVLTVNLPATAGLLNGDMIIIYVDSASVVTVQANTNQTIQVGNEQSTVGGRAVSTAEGSVLTLVFRIADLEWHSISVEGTWTTE